MKKTSECIEELNELYTKVSGRKDCRFMVERGQPGILTGFVQFAVDINVDSVSEDIDETEMRDRYLNALDVIIHLATDEMERVEDERTRTRN